MLAASIPHREICEQLHMGRGVLAKYKKAADNSNLSYADGGRMNEEDLEAFLKSTRPESAPSDARKILDGLIPDYVSDLAHNRYLTVQHLHEDYKREHPDGYGYTQFKKAIRDYQYAHNLSFHNTYLPGEEMQIDFAGDALWLTDPLTGEMTSVVVLVCVLPYSGMAYAKALPDASMEHFFGGISDAFTYFGGTVRKAKSDNMKQWVKKNDRYEPVFTDAATEWGAYYCTTLEACRIKKPRDKGPVEGAVMKIYNAVYAPLHDEVIFDMGSMNNRIFELLDDFNSKPSKVTGRSRLDIFEAEEKSSLGPLPEVPFRFRYRKEVKLSGSYHIQVADRKYSVPYQYVGQNLTVVWDIDTVEVYAGNTRISVHDRNGVKDPFTHDEDMPPEHLEYKRSKACNAAYFLEKSEAIGPYTREAVDAILKRSRHVEQNYSSCHGVLSLDRRYGSERLENACKRLAGYKSITYTMIKNILEKNLDKADDQEPVSTMPQNDYVRGAEAFNI